MLISSIFATDQVTGQFKFQFMCQQTQINNFNFTFVHVICVGLREDIITALLTLWPIRHQTNSICSIYFRLSCVISVLYQLNNIITSINKEMTVTVAFSSKTWTKGSNRSLIHSFSKNYIHHRHNCMIRVGKHPNPEKSSGKQPKRVKVPDKQPKGPRVPGKQPKEPHVSTIHRHKPASDQTQ